MKFGYSILNDTSILFYYYGCFATQTSSTMLNNKEYLVFRKNIVMAAHLSFENCHLQHT